MHMAQTVNLFFFFFLLFTTGSILLFLQSRANVVNGKQALRTVLQVCCKDKTVIHEYVVADNLPSNIAGQNL